MRSYITGQFNCLYGGGYGVTGSSSGRKWELQAKLDGRASN